MQKPATTDWSSPSLLALGFRPFFLLAALFSVAATVRWTALYHGGGVDDRAAAIAWHSHEMIFGYGAAVVTGFLLTAASNWTGSPTLRSNGLGMLALLWLIPRAAGLVSGSISTPAVALFDLAFLAAAVTAISTPLVRYGARRQYLVIALLTLLWLGNALWWSGTLGNRPALTGAGTDVGLYVLVALLMLLGRRVVPSFIERGVGRPVTLRNRAWLDRAVPALFLGFCIADLVGLREAVGVFSAALFGLFSIRLVDWHTPGIWRRPMLWVLYLATAFVGLGFALEALAGFGLAPAFAATHLFAYGGIGLMTLGMMARVSLGHTGRPIQPPPAGIPLAFALLVAGALARVPGPLLVPDLYPTWVGLAQALWVAAFAIFAWRYGPILLRPRIDGRPG